MRIPGKSRSYPSEKEIVARNEMKSKVDEISASIEELQNTPKVLFAFRVTCAKNFPTSSTRGYGASPGNSL